MVGALTKKKAFNLIELLVVVAIIGILAAVGVQLKWKHFFHRLSINIKTFDVIFIKRYITIIEPTTANQILIL